MHWWAGWACIGGHAVPSVASFESHWSGIDTGKQQMHCSGWSAFCASCKHPAASQQRLPPPAFHPSLSPRPCRRATRARPCCTAATCPPTMCTWATSSSCPTEKSSATTFQVQAGPKACWVVMAAARHRHTSHLGPWQGLCAFAPSCNLPGCGDEMNSTSFPGLPCSAGRPGDCGVRGHGSAVQDCAVTQAVATGGTGCSCPVQPCRQRATF